MPRTGAQNRGIARERDLRRLLEADGWWVCRASGSLGDADLLAMRADSRPRLIEVKSTQAGPYAGFLPRDRSELLIAAHKAGADAWLVWWPKRTQPQWIGSSQWPQAREVEMLR